MLLLLLPFFVGILQLGFTLYVRNTLAACAQAGARYAADENFAAQDAMAQHSGDVTAQAAISRTTGCIDEWLSSTYSRDVTGGPAQWPPNSADSVVVVEVKVSSPVPVFGLVPWGKSAITVKADALQERP